MKQYLDLLNYILENGVHKENRTGVDTLSVFGYQMRFNLQDGFPLLTTKKLHFKSLAHELLWMIDGDTNIKYRHEHGVRIWDEWADEEGELGPVYGHMWRDFPINKRDHQRGVFIGGADQLYSVIERIKQEPGCRRLIVSSWHPGYIEEMALPPCHCLYQFYVNEGKLSCQMYQRSADVFLGVPFNIASYALLTMMVAQVTDLEPHEFIHTFGDVHIYENHIDQVKLQLSRDPRPLPKVMLSPGVRHIDYFTYGDIVLLDYDPHPHIKGDIAV